MEGVLTELADIGALRAFVAVADTASFHEGARRIGLTRSAAGKSIARLEEILGARLLHRTTRRVGLTADGQNFYEKALQILVDLEDAQNSVQRGAACPRGVLRVTATEAFGRQIILPILGDYLEQWPELSAEASFTDRVVDVVEDGFDIAIRFGVASVSSELIARVIARSFGQLCASPSYLARHHKCTVIEDLAGHRQLLSGTRENPRAWVLQTGSEPVIYIAARPVLLSDNAGALRDAALAGLGVACLPRFLIDRDVENGALELLLPAYATPEIPISVLYPSRRHLSPKVRLFIELLVARLTNPVGILAAIDAQQ
ncbi:MAG: LysR family transcriptional regulator [Janthinobacterium lividum]